MIIWIEDQPNEDFHFFKVFISINLVKISVNAQKNIVLSIGDVNINDRGSGDYQRI